MQNCHEKVLAEEVQARDAQLQFALEELQVILLVGCTPRHCTSGWGWVVVAFVLVITNYRHMTIR